MTPADPQPDPPPDPPCDLRPGPQPGPGRRPDPGLQPERTLLAWRRTALGLVANGILLVAAGRGTSGIRVWFGIGVIVLALSCWAAVGAVYRQGRPHPVVLGRQAVPWLAGILVLAVGLFDLYAVVTG